MYMRERLEQLLNHHNMKPAQLVQVTGLSSSTVYEIISGKTNELNIGVGKMLKIAQALNVSIEFLYGRDESESSKLLDDSEERLINEFRELNKEGQERILNYIDDIVDTGKYKKHNQVRMVQEA